jgi:drug/metabolite transporter (DMT)-like permease
MDMSLENCWDCPVTLASAVGYLAVLSVLILLGLWLLRRTHASLRALGVIIAFVGVALSLMFTFTVPNWGVINPFAGHLALFSRAASHTLYFTFDAAVLVALAFSFKR